METPDNGCACERRRRHLERSVSDLEEAVRILGAIQESEYASDLAILEAKLAEAMALIEKNQRERMN